MLALYKEPQGVRWGEWPEPEVRAPRDVKIRVVLAGICRTDLYVAQGRMKGERERLVLGHEFCGEVVAFGEEVSTLSLGDRVTAHPLVKTSQGTHQMLGVDLDGAFAQYVVVPEASLVHKLPEGLSLKQGAYAEPVAASLAIANAGLKLGERGVLWGEGRIAGLTYRIMKALGFEEVIWVRTLEELRDLPFLVDWAVETKATQESLGLLVRCIKPGGKLVLKSRPAVAVLVDLQEVVRRGLTLQAVDYGSYDQALGLMSSGKLETEDLFGPVHDPSSFESVFEHLMQHEAQKHFFQMTS